MDDRHPKPGFIEVDGHRLRWSVWPGQDPPLLLVGGLGANIEMWAPLRHALAPRATIAFDAPGAGESSLPLRPLAIDQLSGLVATALNQLAVSEIDVLGYSFGGSVAQALARSRPHLVRRLVLVGATSGWGGLWLNPLAVAALLTPARYFSPQHTRWANRTTFGDPPSASFSHLDRARAARPPHPVGYWWQIVAIATWSSHDWLDQIQHETLVLVGALDRAAPLANSAALARRIGRARLHVVADAGHLLLLADETRDVSSRITDFLDRGHAPDRQPDAAPPLLAER